MPIFIWVCYPYAASHSVIREKCFQHKLDLGASTVSGNTVFDIRLLAGLLVSLCRCPPLLLHKVFCLPSYSLDGDVPVVYHVKKFSPSRCSGQFFPHLRSVALVFRLSSFYFPPDGYSPVSRGSSTSLEVGTLKGVISLSFLIIPVFFSLYLQWTESLSPPAPRPPR